MGFPQNISTPFPDISADTAFFLYTKKESSFFPVRHAGIKVLFNNVGRQNDFGGKSFTF